MTPNQIKLVEGSWDFVLTNTEEAGEIFYGKLFEIDPSLRALFKEDIKAQSQKLVSLLTFAVSKLHKVHKAEEAREFEEFMGEVKKLGQRHSKYNVKAEHYNTVAAALLWTLEKALGNQWNDEMKGAWVAVYTALSQTMIEAGKEHVKV